MTTLFVGIDPGMTGAVAAIDANGGFYGIHDPALGGHQQLYDTQGMLALGQWIASLQPDHVGLEDVHGMPGDGGEQAFKFGQGFESWKMALSAAGVTYQLISPLRWKRHLGLPGKKRDPQARRKAVEMARGFYPQAAHYLKYVTKHDGRAEALLIAHFQRITTYTGLRGLRQQRDGDEDQLMAAILMSSNRRRRGGLR